MPFALILIGLLLVITGAKGTQGALVNELREDFTGAGNFTYWVLALGSIGALGYVDSLRTFSRWFMALIIIAMVLSNQGFFQKLTEALAAGPVSPENTAAPRSLPNEKTSQSAAPTDLIPGAAIMGIPGLTVSVAEGSIADRLNDTATRIGKAVRLGVKLFGL